MNSDETTRRMRPKWQTDVCRAWGRQFGGKGKTLFFAVPFIVGFVVFAAFLGRESPIEKSFIFFATIYAFWIGLFNASNIVTSAVESGEWNYWVLGMKRSFWTWLTANSTVCLILSFIQIAAFMSAVIIASLCFGENGLENCFVITKSDLLDPGFFLPSVAGMSCFTVIALTWGLSMVMAGISGVAFGICVSCFAKDSLGATKMAVGLVVTAMVLSAPVLRKDNNDFPVFPPLWLKVNCETPFLSSITALTENRKETQRKHFEEGPLAEAEEKYNVAFANGTDEAELNRLEETQKALEEQLEKMPMPEKTKHAGFWPHFLEDLSYIFPQRYFYNIGRMMDKDVMSAGDEDDTPVFAYKFRLLKSNFEIAERWKIWKPISNNVTLEKALTENGRNIHGGSFISLFLKLILWEAFACMALSALAFTAGYIKIKNTGEFYAIR